MTFLSLASCSWLVHLLLCYNLWKKAFEWSSNGQLSSLVAPVELKMLEHLMGLGCG
jgi:hypothetical protein